MKASNCSLISLQNQLRGDSTGSLIFLESNRSIPFEVKRIYYIYDTKDGVRRGFHAHKNLKQLAICVSGSCKILIDDGRSKSEFDLNSPDQALYIGSCVWREMFDFSPDCVLLVLASHHYDESDYIRNYEDFLEHASKART